MSTPFCACRNSRGGLAMRGPDWNAILEAYPDFYYLPRSTTSPQKHPSSKVQSQLVHFVFRRGSILAGRAQVHGWMYPNCSPT